MYVWTNYVAPVVCLFQNKEIPVSAEDYVYVTKLIYDKAPLSGQPLLSSHLIEVQLY